MKQLLAYELEKVLKIKSKKLNIKLRNNNMDCKHQNILCKINKFNCTYLDIDLSEKKII